MLKWLGVSIGVVVLDQLSKYAILRAFALREVLELTPFFNIVLVFNRGAAFSLLSDAGGWQRELFVGIALAASTWIIWLLRKYWDQVAFCLALSLILGGAIGNVIDRLVRGAVVDFLDFHAFGYHWPAFNVADSAITCGAILLIWDSIRTKGRGVSSADERRGSRPV